MNTHKSHKSQMQNITTHFWVGSGWPSHGIWQPTLSRSNPHRWSRSEREKEDRLETIKRNERKSNLLHVRESLALEIKIKGAKNITWKISKKSAKMYWTYQKIRVTESNKNEIRKVLHLFFCVTNIKILYMYNTHICNRNAYVGEKTQCKYTFFLYYSFLA